jgi:hypothetical protein
VQNSINRQLGIASVNAYKPLALLCFIIEVHTLLLNLPHASDIALAAVARHLCSYLPPNFRGGFLARAELLAATCVPRGRSDCADKQRDIQFARSRKPDIARYVAALFPSLALTCEKWCSTSNTAATAGCTPHSRKGHRESALWMEELQLLGDRGVPSKTCLRLLPTRVLYRLYHACVAIRSASTSASDI